MAAIISGSLAVVPSGTLLGADGSVQLGHAGTVHASAAMRANSLERYGSSSRSWFHLLDPGAAGAVADVGGCT